MLAIEYLEVKTFCLGAFELIKDSQNHLYASCLNNNLHKQILFFMNTGLGNIKNLLSFYAIQNHLI